MRVLLAILFLTTTCILRSAEVESQKAGDVIHFTADGQAICDYQMQPGAVPEGVSKVFQHGAHLHPVFTPSGKLVTGNHPADHRWHRGIWLAWTKTEFGNAHPDFWNQGKGDGVETLSAEIRFEKLDKLKSNGFVSQHRFIDHSIGAAKDVLHETWELHVAQEMLDGRMANVIDLISTQTCAGETPLKLPQYHYGGLGVRGNELWNAVPDVVMLTSEGHDRVKGDATKGRWVYIGGKVDGAPAGLAVLMHPSNFRFPQPLRLNPKNPQLCIAPSQDGPWAIEPGKEYVSKYRIVVFDGAADPAWIEARWKEYASPKP